MVVVSCLVYSYGTRSATVSVGALFHTLNQSFYPSSSIPGRKVAAVTFVWSSFLMHPMVHEKSLTLIR